MGTRYFIVLSNAPMPSFFLKESASTLIHTPSTRNSFFGATSLLAAYAICYALAMLLLGGATFDRLYAPSPYHRLQAAALLDGHLFLSDDVSRIEHDLAWHDGQINHVWGLGVGLWLTPFQALWRAIGQDWFPDRIALGVAFGLLAWYAGYTGLDLSRRLSVRGAACAGFICLILLCPALWTLNYGPRLIYEETSLYACIVSLAILIATFRVAWFGCRKGFLICSLLCAFVAIVRPTHGIYGVAGMLVCAALWIARKGNLAFLVVCVGIYIGGLTFLVLTNISRFGAPFEFGHRLTVTPDLIVYTTRLGNPMEQASFFEALRELMGFLFWAGDLTRDRVAGEPLVYGQAPFERWRDPYVTTFDLVWLLVGIAAGLAAIKYLLRRHTSELALADFGQAPKGVALVAILIWGGVGVGGLGFFYLRLATFSSRYLLDFSPAFTAILLVGWAMVPRKWTLFAFFMLVGWLGFEIATTQFLPVPVPLKSRDEASIALHSNDARKTQDYNGAYDLRNAPAASRISYNGFGWNSEVGAAGHIVILVIDSPRYIELIVSPREWNEKAEHGGDRYRAMIAGRFLPEPIIVDEGERIKVRFSLPEGALRRSGEEILFLWFGRDYSPGEKMSVRFMHSVRWKDALLLNE